MRKLYLITGATGHLGTVLLSKLRSKKEKDYNIRVLVLPGEESFIPDDIECVTGDVRNIDSLDSFFDRTGYDYVALFHCAAIVTILSKDDSNMWDVNVGGSENIFKKALENNIDRVIYVNSVHGIPENPIPEIITEVTEFSPDLVNGQYAKSKAAAAALALEYVKKGLNLIMVHPSGIIGPGDIRDNNHSVRTVRAMYYGQIPFSIKGGYDFVDSRDVADGMILCLEKGRIGESYILNGEYISIEEMMEYIDELRDEKDKKWKAKTVPDALVESFAPISEWFSMHLGNKKPLLTPYSVQTLNSNGFFCHEKASKELGYHPMPIKESIKDTIFNPYDV